MYDIPDPNRVETIADWAEFYVMITQSELSKSELRSYVEASSGSEPSDELIDSVLMELETREKLYGVNPPFSIQGSLIQPAFEWKERPEYMTCLIFALEGNPIDPLQSGVLFERIINEAIRNFIGGESIPVGFPNTRKAEDIANSLNEHYVYEPPEYRQDRNLDVVAWKPFSDERASQIVVLIQCAAGRNWTSKKTELNLDAWCKYIHFACKPIKGLAIPIVITDKIRVEEDSTDAGLILDRTRIYRNITKDLTPGELHNDLETWCMGRLAEMTA